MISLIKRWSIERTSDLVIKKFINITSLLLLLVFLMPTIIKFEHHHVHLTSNVKNDKHYPEFKEKCAICDFEFSVFSSEVVIIDLQKEQYFDTYCNNYSSFSYSKHSIHSFSLRAPPLNIHS